MTILLVAGGEPAKQGNRMNRPTGALNEPANGSTE